MITDSGWAPSGIAIGGVYLDGVTGEAELKRQEQAGEIP
jgi:hypothetical protein